MSQLQSTVALWSLLRMWYVDSWCFPFRAVCEALRCASNLGCARADLRCRRHPRSLRSIFELELCPPMAPRPPIEDNGDIGTSPFWGSSSDKSVLACLSVDGDARDKAQWCLKELIRG